MGSQGKRARSGAAAEMMENKTLFYKYGKTEIEYLKSKDKILGVAIDKIGHIRRPVNTDFFSALVFHVIGQQISSAAHKTVWERLNKKLEVITPTTISDIDRDEFQKIGITFKKVECIKNISEKIKKGELNIEELKIKSDSEVINELSKLKGIGQWTAEMILIFCLERPNILSYSDLGIQRGLRILYRHRSIDRKIFEKYRCRYNPYNTVASLYLWSIAAGNVEGLKDFLSK
jgi:DNA-3-methyladenine glycosylase II